MTNFADGLVNVVAQLGTERDKAAHTRYALSQWDMSQLLAAYRSSWLPRAIVDIPAEDATRKWRSWLADADQISAIEDVEKRLHLAQRVLEAYKAARLFGGAAIYIGTSDRDPTKPLDPARVRELRHLTVLTPLQLSPGEVSRDIESVYYGRPEFYNLTSQNAGQVRIHASRMAVFGGSVVPDVTQRQSGWDDSVLQSTMDAIMQADSTNANVNSLIFEAKIDVFRFQGIMDLMHGGTNDDVVVKRLNAMMAMKGINGAVVLDKEDEYDQKSASFASLPELMDRFMNNVAGASRIPVTRLFGRASVGLSGTGDGDERVYFDHVQHLQTTQLEPALATLDECIIWQALGSRPEEIFYNWRPLRQLTEKDRAEIFATTANAARSLAGATAGEIIPMDALSDAVVNEFVESGVLPGLEQKIEEYGSLAEQNDLGGVTE